MALVGPKPTGGVELPEVVVLEGDENEEIDAVCIVEDNKQEEERSGKSAERSKPRCFGIFFDILTFLQQAPSCSYLGFSYHLLRYFFCFSSISFLGLGIDIVGVAQK